MHVYLASSITVIVVMMFFGSVTASSTRDASGTAADLGRITTASSVNHTFTIRNPDDTDLEITDIRPACGCTVTKLSSRTIKPGQSAELATTLDLKGIRGKFAKTITLDTSDPKKPELVLTLKGEVVPRFELSPQRIAMGRLTRGESVTRAIDILGREDNSITVSGVEAVWGVALRNESNADGSREGVVPRENAPAVSDGGESLTVTLETIERGRTYRVHVTVAAPNQVGDVRGEVRIKTTDADEPLITVPVSATVVGEVAVSPGEIVLMGDSTMPVTRYLLVTPGAMPDGVKTFKITAIQTPAASVAGDFRALGTRGYQVRLSNLTSAAELDGKSIVIKTDIPGAGDIVVPIRIVREPPESSEIPATPVPPDSANTSDTPTPAASTLSPAASQAESASQNTHASSHSSKEPTAP